MVAGMLGAGGLLKDWEDRHPVKAWSFGEDVVLESCRYAPGPAAELPKHAHEEYQICLSLNFPGEVHSARDPKDRRDRAEYRMMYASPNLLGQVAAEIDGRETASPPFFPNPVLLDGDLARRFMKLHAALEGSASRLEKDSRLLSVLACFLLRHADMRPSPEPPGSEHRAVKLVRGYLEDNLGENVSLEELSSLAHLSPFHLSRVFKNEVGIPPHAYQTQARVARAKGLLLGGWPITRVALETGFADQSHLARHFKRLVGVARGSYARNSKNVQ
jgi:AraC-like DNA-binding protein